MITNHQTDTQTFHVSWGDLVTLLMVFFVYLFAISDINVDKFMTAQASIHQEFSNQPLPSEVSNYFKQHELLETMNEQIQELSLHHQLGDQVVVDLLSDRLEIQLKDQVLFELGQANLHQNAFQILKKLGWVFSGLEGQIMVVGHTDNIPIQTDTFSSNWELSSARAEAVVHYLIDQGLNPEMFTVIGAGEYQPIVTNDSQENQAKNRRVTIIIKPNVVSKGVLHNV